MRRRPVASRSAAAARMTSFPSRCVSDFDQMRDHWVKKPLDYLSVFTSRQTAPRRCSPRAAKSSRCRRRPAGASSRWPPTPAFGIAMRALCPMASASLPSRPRPARPNSGSIPQTGSGNAEQWTNDAKVLRWDGVPSPDGRWLAHRDKDQQLWIFDIKTKADKSIAQSMNGDFDDLTWSPDSQWLAYCRNCRQSVRTDQGPERQNRAPFRRSPPTATTARIRSGVPTASGSTSSQTAC